MSSHLPPSLAVESLSQKKLGIDIVRAVRKDKYEPLQVTPFPVLRVSRLFYFFAHLDLLSTDSSLLWSYFFFLSLLWLFPPLLLHLSISSEIWLLNFLRWIQTGCILETKQTHTHIYVYIHILHDFVQIFTTHVSLIGGEFPVRTSGVAGSSARAAEREPTLCGGERCDFEEMIHLQGGAPKIAKLVYNSNN